MAGPWDSMMKKMIGANPEHFVQWLRSDAIFIDTVDIELKNQHRFADALLLIEKVRKGGEHRRGLLQIECQTYHDPEMEERLLEYNVLASRQYKLPVYSYVMYLTKDGEVAQPPYIRTFLDDEEIHHFWYRAVEVYNEKAETLMQIASLGVLPLVTLTKGGKRTEVVQAMIDRLVAAEEYDLLAIAQVMGGLAFKRGSEQESFRRKFSMYQDMLRKSWVYEEIGQEFLEKGREKGREQALHETLITYVQARFPRLVVLAKQQTNSITDPTTLNHIMSTLFTLQTPEEVERYLLTLGSDATKN